MKIRFTDAAQDAYTAVVDYLSARNPSSAERFVDDVDAALDRLRRFPESGPIIRESPKGPFRQFLVQPYRFFYRLDAEVVLIVAVWHGAQQATPPDI